MMVDDSKRYYWLKLKEDFFQDEAIEWLEEQTNGKDYVLFYLKLCLKSLKNNGVLIRQVGNILVPYDIEKLGEITKTSVDTVAVALKVFKQIGLVEIQENGKLYLSQLNSMVGSETEAAKRKREQRNKQIGTMSGQNWDNVPQSIEYRDKSIDIRVKNIKEKDNKKKVASDNPSAKHKYGSYENVLLSDEEIKKLKTEFPADWQERIERVSEYVASKGKPYKDYLATIRSWARREKESKGGEKVAIRRTSGEYEYLNEYI